MIKFSFFGFSRTATKQLIYWFIFFLTLLVIIQIGELLWFGWQGFYLKKEAESFSYQHPNPTNSILVVGDSTGVGAGAAVPKETISGLLAKDGAEVVNLSRWGAYTRDVLGQLTLVNNRHFDTVLIFTGGNDILWWQDLNTTSQALRKVIASASQISDRVLLLPPANIGLAPIFREPIGIIYRNRTKQVREQFLDIAKEANITYIDLYTDNLSELFLSQPVNLFAPDLLHPSSEGYYLWYLKIREALDSDLSFLAVSG